MDLLFAAESGDLSRVTFLIEHGADPNTPTEPWEATILGRAAAKGHVEVVRWLVAHYGLGPEGGVSALFHAAENGYTEIVRILLEAGANPNTLVHRWGASRPLVVAAWHRRTEIVPLLIDHGALISPPDPSQVTALSYVAAAGGKRMARLLAERGAAQDDIDRAMGTAIGYGHHTTALALIESGRVSREAIRQPALLRSAVRNGTPKLVKSLLERGADPNTVDDIGLTVADWAKSNPVPRHRDAILALLNTASA